MQVKILKFVKVVAKSASVKVGTKSASTIVILYIGTHAHCMWILECVEFILIFVILS